MRGTEDKSPSPWWVSVLRVPWSDVLMECILLDPYIRPEVTTTATATTTAATTTTTTTTAAATPAYVMFFYLGVYR